MNKVSTDIRGSVASRLLQQFWLCEGLSASDLTRIARVASFRSMARGEVVIDYGGSVHDVYCVLGGMVKLLVNTGQRNEKIIELVSAGQTFGEALLFLGQPSPTRAVAIDDGRLLVLPGSVLTDMLDSSPGLAVWWLRRVSQRVGGLLAELKADAGQSAAQRIVRWLVAKVGGQAGETRIRLDISKANLAASLNTTPESFFARAEAPAPRGSGARRGAGDRRPQPSASALPATLRVLYQAGARERDRDARRAVGLGAAGRIALRM
jgi:CRP-like cAMP-binding protein